MKPRLFVIVGLHGAIRSVAKPAIASLKGFTYNTSLDDDLRHQSICKPWERCEVFDELLMLKEFQRDTGMLPLLRDRSVDCVVVEQWHLGNIASMNSRASKRAEHYTSELARLILEMEDIPINVAYVSTDLDKLVSPEFRDYYERYLQQLELLLRRFKLALNPIDGEAPPSMAKERLLHLLSVS